MTNFCHERSLITNLLDPYENTKLLFFNDELQNAPYRKTTALIWVQRLRNFTFTRSKLKPPMLYFKSEFVTMEWRKKIYRTKSFINICELSSDWRRIYAFNKIWSPVTYCWNCNCVCLLLDIYLFIERITCLDLLFV